MTCEPCREQILPYLYELLEPLDRQQLTAHIESCGACQETLKAAQEQIGLLAEAVKPEKATIVFKAPVKATPASTAPTVLLGPTPRRFALLNRWSLAASVLLVLLMISAVVGGSIWRDRSASLAEAHARLAKARADLSKSTEELDRKNVQTQQEIRAIHEQLDEVFNQWRTQESNTRNTLEKERVQIVVNGPRVAQAGAPNRYDVELRQQGVANNFLQNNFNQKAQNFDNKQAQLPGNFPNLQARVVNQKNQEVLYEQKLKMLDNSRANFDLPTDLPIKPGDELAIEFQTQMPNGKYVSVRDNLRVVLPEYVTHLATDRPMYRPGDTVRFRSLTLERFRLTPAQRDFHLRYRVVGPNNLELYTKEVASRVVSSKANHPIKGPNGQPLRGLGVGEYVLPGDLPEGVYTLAVNEVNESFNEEKRSFQVRRWQTPRFHKEVTLNRTTYGPGDAVKVSVRVTPMQGPPMGANGLQVNAQIKVDDTPLTTPTRQVDAEGRAEFDFNLPAQIFKGVATVIVHCGDEKVVRPLPIVLNDLTVDFYPEGGELIAGVPNRVYFQARTPANRPADFQGVILDDRKKEIVRIQTLNDDREPGLNQGMGSFTFTPQAKKRYTLRIDAPIGIERPLPLPIAIPTGVALHLPQGVVENEIGLTLHSATQPRELLVGAYCRGRMLDYKLVQAPADMPTPVTLRPQAGVGGVFRVTVFEKTRDRGAAYFRPVAERLVYRKSPARIDVAIESDRISYQPGEPVELRLTATNEKKENVPAVALVAVVDRRVHLWADDQTTRSMPTHFLLTTEIRNPEDLENADVLLGNHPKAGAALDLLLGCQGWRRFAEQDPKVFAQRQPQQGNPPIFLANSATVPQFLDTEQKQIDTLDQNFVAKAIDLNQQLAERERDEKGPPELTKRIEERQMDVQNSQTEIEQVHQRVRNVRGFLVQFGLGGALLLLLFVGFFLLSVGLRRLSDGGNARPWLFLGLALLSLLFLVSVIGTFTFMGEPFLDDWRFKEERMAKGLPKGAPPHLNPAQQGPLPTPVDESLLEEIRKEPQAAGAKRALRTNADRPGLVQPGPMEDDMPGPVGAAPAVVPNEPDERALRQQGAYQTLLQRQLGRRVQLPPAKEPCIVREYAHHYKPAKDAAHHDVSATLYWQPVLVLPDGKATVNFDLSDAITRYDVAVLSYTLDGRLGANRAEIAAQLPYTIEPTAPLEVTETDRIAISVAVANKTSKEISVPLAVRGKGLAFEDGAERSLIVKANETRREVFHVRPTIKEGAASFLIAGANKDRRNAVERTFKVVPDGFPVVRSVGGVLDNGVVEHVIDLPESLLPGSLKVNAIFYPSPLAELQGGLDAMSREPTGCFEQTASTNYANVLILNYLKDASPAGSNPRAEMQARLPLQAGYQKLTTFECVDPANHSLKRGYEWFGGIAPPNHGLTAYGLGLFRDMAKLQSVDTDMLQRTQRYLLEARDGKGGFQRNPSGAAPDVVTNAYIVWALTESGVQESFDVELAALREECKVRKDPYFHSLVALSHLNRKKPIQGLELLRALRAFQEKDGHIAGAITSITGSQGRDLAVETTALAILGWHQADRPGDFNLNLQNAVRWLGQQRRGEGDFGGTQATILALKALLAHHHKNPQPPQGGEVSISVRQGAIAGQPAGDFGFPNDAQGFSDPSRAAFGPPNRQDSMRLTLRDPASLAPGKHTIHLKASNGNSLPYTLSWSYRTLKFANDPAAPIKVNAKLSAAEARQGEVVKLNAVIENVSGRGQGLTVAVLGLPAGLALPEDRHQLDALAQTLADGKSGKISAWELRGRELVLYWRGMAPEARVEIDLDLLCRMPGFYRGPASRAYLYYDGDRKYWNDPVNIRILEAK